ncbi:Crp/Fnr family transcriptional regulator [Limnochorda pilosa]|uniref:cAMP-binding protein n=1 Tax=Limnochorda pilosa TaxID=1555112 RepID=A0A0K2SHR9_LIMPI|nr:Crp/Fnr family transcriptional regulator [Limnochorda pilosa]BAS26640.1 cAMP-binding protein [Limnochorda pilosa]
MPDHRSSRWSEILGRIPALEGLPAEDLAPLARVVEPRRFHTGEVVFREGEPVRAIYLVGRGMVKAATADGEGREQILSVLARGDLFPHVGLLEGGGYPATATCLEESELGEVSRAAFLAVLSRNPDLTVRLLLLFSQRLRLLQDQVRELTLADAATRVARILERLARRAGLPGDDGLRLPPHLNQETLARMAGVTRETTNRVLARFRREGSLRVTAEGLVVLDLEGLAGRSRSPADPRPDQGG